MCIQLLGSGLAWTAPNITVSLKRQGTQWLREWVLESDRLVQTQELWSLGLHDCNTAPSSCREDQLTRHGQSRKSCSTPGTGKAKSYSTPRTGKHFLSLSSHRCFHPEQIPMVFFREKEKKSTSHPPLCFFFFGVSSSEVLLPRPREPLFSFWPRPSETIKTTTLFTDFTEAGQDLPKCDIYHNVPNTLIRQNSSELHS